MLYACIFIVILMLPGFYLAYRGTWIVKEHKVWLLICKEYYHDWAMAHPDEPQWQFKEYLYRGMDAFGTFDHLLYSKPFCWNFMELAIDIVIVNDITGYIIEKRHKEVQSYKSTNPSMS
jgi:hypothetical protein